MFIISAVARRDHWARHDTSVVTMLRAPGSVSVDGIVPRCADLGVVPVFLGRGPGSS